MRINPNDLRRRVLKMVYDKQSGHIGGSFSLADVVAYLYSNYSVASADGDKLILSKGHAVPIIYAALREVGKLTDADLDTFRECDSILQGHPDKLRLPLVHATTGSLGQGLSIAIGHALALRGTPHKVFCILGDGEMQEGQVWEALMFAAKLKLANLVCIIDRNGGQGDGKTDDVMPLGDLPLKVNAFGWAVIEINGHDRDQIDLACQCTTERPKAIIMNTVKGHGVSFMTHPDWHSKSPNAEEYVKAIEELNNVSH